MINEQNRSEMHIIEVNCLQEDLQKMIHLTIEKCCHQQKFDNDHSEDDWGNKRQ